MAFTAAAEHNDEERKKEREKTKICILPNLGEKKRQDRQQEEKEKDDLSSKKKKSKCTHETKHKKGERGFFTTMNLTRKKKDKEYPAPRLYKKREKVRY